MTESHDEIEAQIVVTLTETVAFVLAAYLSRDGAGEKAAKANGFSGLDEMCAKCADFLLERLTPSERGLLEDQTNKTADAYQRYKSRKPFQWSEAEHDKEVIEAEANKICEMVFGLLRMCQDKRRNRCGSCDGWFAGGICPACYPEAVEKLNAAIRAGAKA